MKKIKENLIKGIIGSILLAITFGIITRDTTTALIFFVFSLCAYIAGSAFVDLIYKLLSLRKNTEDRKVIKEDKTNK